MYMTAAGERNSSGGPEVEGDREGDYGESERVSDESRGTRGDIDVYEGNQGVGSEVEGDGGGVGSESESVLSEERSNLQDVDVFEYEMELARICLGENGEY